MKKLYINLKDRNSIIPPREINQALYNQFPTAINTEWYFEENIYETIFYFNSKEYIACFDLAGNLLQYKINLPLAETPKVVLDALKSDKELMNVVEIHVHDSISYEIILRDKELIRYVAIIDPDGNISDEIPL